MVSSKTIPARCKKIIGITDEELAAKEEIIEDRERRLAAEEKKFLKIKEAISRREPEVSRRERENAKLESGLKKKASQLNDLQINLEKREVVVGDKEKILKKFELAKVVAMQERNAAVSEREKLEKMIPALVDEARKKKNFLALVEKELSEKKAVLQKQVIEKQQALDKQIAGRGARLEKELADKKLRFEREFAEKKQAIDASIVTRAASFEKDSQSKRKMLDKEFASIHGTVEKEIAKKKAKAYNEIAAKKKALEKEFANRKIAFYRESSEMNKQITAKTAQFNELQKEVFDREEELAKVRKDIDAKEVELLKIEAALNYRTKSLDEREREIVHKELDWTLREDQIKEAAQKLAREKEEFDDEFRLKTAEFVAIKKDWEERKAELNMIRGNTRKEKEKIATLVAHDSKALAEKEDEIVRAVRSFETDKAKLAAEEDSLMKKVKELERATAVFRKEEKKLNEREKEVGRMESYAESTVAKLESMKKKLDGQQEKLANLKILNRDVSALTRQRDELYKEVSKAKSRLKTLGAMPAAKRRAEKAQAAGAVTESVEEIIDEAKGHISARDFEEAEKSIGKLEHVHSETGGKQKKTLGYELSELRTSLKLAQLE